MYMGESDSTASQPPKPVCDWILGFRTGEVKRKSPSPKSAPKRFNPNSLSERQPPRPLCKTCGKALTCPSILCLTDRNLGAYYLPPVLFSRPRTIMVAVSSFCHIVLDIIR